MAVFNHAITYKEYWLSDLNENIVTLDIDYDNAFEERQKVVIKFHDPCQSFDIRRVKVTGRATTGISVHSGVVIGRPRLDLVELVCTNGQTRTCRWIDKTEPSLGLKADILESLHPVTGQATFLATTQRCPHPELISMNVFVLDNSGNPFYSFYVNPFTGDLF